MKEIGPVQEKKKESKEGEVWSEIASRYDEMTIKVVGKEIMEEIKMTIKKYLESDIRILEIGSGTGYYSEVITNSEKNLSHVGLDISKEMVEISSSKKFLNSSFVVGDCKALPFDSDSFDLVLILNVIHMISDPELAIIEAKRVLKPDGKIIVISYSLTNHSFFQKVVDVFKFIKVYGLSIVFRQLKYVTSFTVDSLATLVSKHFLVSSKDLLGKNNSQFGAIFVEATKENSIVKSTN